MKTERDQEVEVLWVGFVYDWGVYGWVVLFLGEVMGLALLGLGLFDAGCTGTDG